MTSDLLSALEVCFKRDALNKSMFTLLYFTRRGVGPVCENVMSSTRPEVRNVCSGRRTETVPWALCTKMLKFSRVVFEICEWRDRQTNKQTDILITILHNPPGSDVNIQTTHRHSMVNATITMRQVTTKESHDCVFFLTRYLLFIKIEQVPTVMVTTVRRIAAEYGLFNRIRQEAPPI